MNKTRTIESFVCIVVLVAVLFVGVWQIKPAQATELFSDGFESGDLSAWTYNSTTPPAVVAGAAYAGSYGANVSASYMNVTKILATSNDTTFARGYFKFHTLPSSNGAFYEFLEVGNNVTDNLVHYLGMQVYYNSSLSAAVWRLYNHQYALIGNNYDETVSADTWYCVEIRANKAYSGPDLAYINGALVCNDSSTDGVGVKTDTVIVGGQIYGSGCSYFYADNIVFSDAYIGTLGDVTLPTFSGFSTNTTIAGAPIRFNVTVTDNVGLSHYIFCTNNTGTPINETATAFSTNPETVSVIKTLNDTVGVYVQSIWYANDTSNNNATSSTQTLVTTTSSFQLSINSTPVSVTYGINSTAYTFPSWTVGTPVTAAGIQSAVNSALAAGGGTVYIPAGDWQVDQAPLAPYGQGGAIFIDLETLPSGAWLNIIGSYTNTTVLTQNGQTLKDVPNTILRSYMCYNDNLTQPYGTFGIVGSNASGSNLNNVKSADRHIRISGITILGYVINDGTVNSNPTVGISIKFVDGFLIDNVVIDSNTGSDISSTYSKGVISHCVFTQLYHASVGGVWGYGVSVGGNFGYYSNGLGTPTWIQNVSQIIGQYDWQGITLNWTCPVNNDLSVKGTTSSISFTAGPVYIEYCQLNRTRHPITSSSYGYYVVRYCSMFGGVGIQALDQHGGGVSLAANGYATRGTEVYNCTINGNKDGGLSDVGYATYNFGLRGGASLIFNNTLQNTITSIALGNENYNSSYPTYPEYINDVWIWNNTFSDVTTELHVDSGTGIVAGTNYFSDIPTPTTPAPPKTGYVPFAVPHPLAFTSYFGVTNTTLTLAAAHYQIQVYASVTVGGVVYVFEHWDDASTNPTRIIDFTATTTITADYVVSATVTVIITYPANTTYSASTISVDILASGGTIDKIWWNCKNGTTWIYGSNQTYTAPTSMTGFVNGTSYIFYAWANNTLGEWDEETVMFTVLIIVVPYDWGSFWGDWWGIP